jgi:hypothetical protein
VRGITLKAAHDVEADCRLQALKNRHKISRSFGQYHSIFIGSRVASATQQDRSAVLDLGRHHLAGDGRRTAPFRECKVLGAAQQYVATGQALHARSEAPASIQPDDTPAILRAPLEQGRRDRDLAEDDDGTEPQERRTQPKLPLHLDPDGIMIQPQDGRLRLNVQDVQQLTHRIASVLVIAIGLPVPWVGHEHGALQTP